MEGELHRVSEIERVLLEFADKGTRADDREAVRRFVVDNGDFIARAILARSPEPALMKQIAAYRLLAVNEGWSHRMVDAYGHTEYARHRIDEIDRKAERTIVSGYDAQGWLDKHVTAGGTHA